MNMNLYTLLTSFADDIKLSLGKFSHLTGSKEELTGMISEVKPIKEHKKSPSVFGQKVDP